MDTYTQLILTVIAIGLVTIGWKIGSLVIRLDEISRWSYKASDHLKYIADKLSFDAIPRVDQGPGGKESDDNRDLLPVLKAIYAELKKDKVK